MASFLFILQCKHLPIANYQSFVYHRILAVLKQRICTHFYSVAIFTLLIVVARLVVQVKVVLAPELVVTAAVYQVIQEIFRVYA